MGDGITIDSNCQLSIYSMWLYWFPSWWRYQKLYVLSRRRSSQMFRVYLDWKYISNQRCNNLRLRVIGITRSGQSSLREYLSKRYDCKAESSEDFSRRSIGDLKSYDKIFIITRRQGFHKSLSTTNNTLEATSQKPADINRYVDECIRYFSERLGDKLTWLELDEMKRNPNFPYLNKRD